MNPGDISLASEWTFGMPTFSQWAVVGDTFPVGCKFQNSIVFRSTTFIDNPDEQNPAYKYSNFPSQGSFDPTD